MATTSADAADNPQPKEAPSRSRRNGGHAEPEQPRGVERWGTAVESYVARQRPRRAGPRAQAPPCRTEPSSRRPHLHRRPTEPNVVAIRFLLPPDAIVARLRRSFASIAVMPRPRLC
ncbi:hypothetical protein PVAP13_4NG062955 [Panicum virgatum]|uniref:Uncharacterized protein n=1 Tax=Panicum virgatum TaxID=38727 RepID=A0A8T0T5N9_PANVG|nr:hypothetical protein PVAP13_4NG062955 [Panicum virgatum]